MSISRFDIRARIRGNEIVFEQKNISAYNLVLAFNKLGGTEEEFDSCLKLYPSQSFFTKDGAFAVTRIE